MSLPKPSLEELVPFVLLEILRPSTPLFILINISNSKAIKTKTTIAVTPSQITEKGKLNKVYLLKVPSLVSLLKARLVARLAYLKKKAKKDLLLSDYRFTLIYKGQVISSLSQIISYIKKVLEELKP